MPFARPTLTALRNQSVEDITTSGVPGLTGLLRNAVLRVLAWCMAGLAYSVYGYADWIARMGVPFTAEDEFLYAWAALIGIYPLDATAATGSAAFTGSTDLVIPNGTALTRQDGTPYQTTADGTVDASGNVTVPMVALVAGAFTNCDDGTPISISLPIASINSGGVTVGPTVGGSDQETNDALRTRMLVKYAAPPQGGATTDYINWALEVPGCTRAWCVGQGYGPGSVVVYPMFDDSEAAHGGFPQGTDGCAAEELRGPTATGDQSLVAEFLRLLPRGRIWRRGWGEIEQADILTLMPVWARLSARLNDLITQIFPCSTTELLPEWEASLGLPDPCTGPLGTIQQRTAAVCAKFSARGGSSRAYFERLAASLGFEITIQTYVPFTVGRSRVGDHLYDEKWAWAWQITASETQVVYFRVGQSTVGEPLATWGNQLLECEIRAHAPADTTPIFSYTLESSIWDAGDLIWDGGELIWDQGLVVQSDE